MKRFLPPMLWLLALAAATGAPVETPAGRADEVLAAALHFSENSWDESAGLLRANPPGGHLTRESTWYALGLLRRNRPGDDARARRIIDRVLAQQYVAPGQRWDGTFRRQPEEPEPEADAKLWRDYDPNWREFIGSTFALMLDEYGERLPPALQARMLDAIRRAVEGELTQGRDEPYHTNIKLMHGFLWSWAGARLGRADWVAGGERWAELVAAAFAVHGTFEEYNSPTYYGVDLYGLVLWRKHGATPRLRALGQELEAALWRETARFYHAGLRNLCGPFDRAYGMDMNRYVSLMGVWLALVLPLELTPLPDPAGPMDHAHDFFSAPVYVVLGPHVPDDALAEFHAFSGERTLRRPIEGMRIATAWLAPTLMLGGEITGATRAAGPDTTYNQFHPATLHWRAPGNALGWMRLYAAPACDAEAAPGRLSITAPRAGDFVFRLAAPGLVAAALTRDQWDLPGLRVKIETDATAITVAPCDGGQWEITYRGAAQVTLRPSS